MQAHRGGRDARPENTLPAFAYAHAMGADVISTDHTEVTTQTVADAHKRGMRIVPFTVNNPDRMRELILMGVDGIITDRPSTLRAVCKDLGMQTCSRNTHQNGVAIGQMSVFVRIVSPAFC